MCLKNDTRFMYIYILVQRTLPLHASSLSHSLSGHIRSHFRNIGGYFVDLSTIQAHTDYIHMYSCLLGTRVAYWRSATHISEIPSGITTNNGLLN